MTPAVAGRVLDVPALLDLAVGRTAYLRALVTYARGAGHTLAVPAAALARAAADVDVVARRELAWAMGMPHMVVLALDRDAAFDAAQHAADRLDGDVVAGHVAQTAADRRGWSVVTSTEAAVTWRALGVETETLP